MELTVDEALKQGISAHKAGKLEIAERFYRAILSSQPAHPDANHNLGVISVSVNKAEEALRLFKNAVDANPEIEQFWLSYIDALMRLSDHALAAQVVTNARQAGFSSPRLLAFEKQLRSNLSPKGYIAPQGLTSQLNDDCRELSQAMEFREVGKYREAQEWLYKFSQQRPDNPEALSLLSQVLLLDGKEVEAEKTLRAAASINPELPSVYRNQARLLLNQSRIAEALDKAESGCDKSPEDRESKLVFAACLGAHKRDEEALAIIEEILEAEPHYAEAYANRALIRLRAQDIEGAIVDAEKAVSIKPHFTQIWQLLGSLHQRSRNLTDAIKALRVAQKNQPNRAPLLIQLGEFLRQDNRLDEAIDVLEKATQLAPKDPNAWINLGASFQQQKRIADAKEAYGKALALHPKSAAILSNLGAMAKESKEWDAAIGYLNRALALDPNLAEAHMNLGVTFKELGRLNEAEASYRRAIALNPDLAAAHYSLGNTLKDLRRPDEALASFTQAVVLGPNLAEAHNNLGSTLQELGRLDEAEQSYRQAIALRPDFAEAYSNLGSALTHKGCLDEAVAIYVQALALKPDCADIYINFGNVIKNARFTASNLNLYPVLTQLLTGGNYARPKYLAAGILSLLEHDPTLKDLLSTENFSLNLEEANSIVQRLDNLVLLHDLMRLSPLPDLRFERLFVVLRKVFLFDIKSVQESPELINFLSTLALHNFINEYIFPESDEEVILIKELVDEMGRTASESEQPTLVSILCLACYRPLYKFSWVHKVSTLDNFTDLKVRLIEEPLSEKAIAQKIPSLNKISNNVSLRVKKQYEENPYPRWVKLGVPIVGKSIGRVCDDLHVKLPSKEIKNISAPSILVAGCGTGQNSIETATRFSDCHVTAIDLSRTSLAYAQRKTSELGLSNLVYLQADILDVHQMQKTFDFIECSGVLHHMDDPMTGWGILTDILKPGGLMKIGLYSEVARRPIVKVREEIASLQIGSSEAEIRKYRQSLIESNNQGYQVISKAGDFFNLSMLRDMIFHVQEHRFSLPEIKISLDKLGLKFCGFELKNLVSSFKEFHGKGADIYDLTLWHEFEESNPNAFFAMYQFWCQKA